MHFIQVGNVNLQYDDSITDIERIKKIIKLNNHLFLDYKDKIISLVKTNESNNNVIYVNNFDDFFEKMLNLVINDKKFISIFNNPYLLPSLYIQLLVKEISKNSETFIETDDNITDDMLWFVLACKYFDCKTQFDEL